MACPNRCIHYPWEGLRFVFRNFPLSTAHPHAQHAAEAAEAADAQGKFWEMHDLLYEHQESLDDAHLRRFAEQIGLDIDRFERDMAENRYAARVREDFMSGCAAVSTVPPHSLSMGRATTGVGLRTTLSERWSTQHPEPY